MTTFAIAIQKKQWDLVSLYLLIAVTERASMLPPESLNALLDLLGGEEQPRKARRRGSR